jgi:zinc/manganese transport system ATP-binding protein
MTAGAGSDLLAVSHVGVTLGGRRILEDVDFSVRPGEFVGFIGTNGSGKTTLLRTILGMIAPDRGSVTIAGRTAASGRRTIGYVPQHVSVDPDAPLSGRDMVGLGFDGDRWGLPLPNRARRAAIDDVLRAVDALHVADAPFGRLSGGEQQRLLVAQALLAKPTLLLLDEPLSNLDMRSANEIVALVAGVARERSVAVLFVAHDMNPLLPFMDRILYLASGRSAIGTVDDVVREDVLTNLYGYTINVLHVDGRVLVVPGSDAAHRHGDHAPHAHPAHA